MPLSVRENEDSRWLPLDDPLTCLRPMCQTLQEKRPEVGRLRSHFARESSLSALGELGLTEGSRVHRLD